MTFLKELFGIKTDYKALILTGAKVIDVRTKAEFLQGHYADSINIPLDDLPISPFTLKKEEVYILCCGSGIRSSKAKSILQAAGFNNVYNVGSWTSIPR